MRYSLLQAICWIGQGHDAEKLTDEEYAEVKDLPQKVAVRELAEQMHLKPPPSKTPTRAEVKRFDWLLRKCLS